MSSYHSQTLFWRKKVPEYKNQVSIIGIQLPIFDIEAPILNIGTSFLHIGTSISGYDTSVLNNEAPGWKYRTSCLRIMTSMLNRGTCLPKTGFEQLYF